MSASSERDPVKFAEKCRVIVPSFRCAGTRKLLSVSVDDWCSAEETDAPTEAGLAIGAAAGRDIVIAYRVL